jgi:CheY-like chemotaxis protein
MTVQRLVDYLTRPKRLLLVDDDWRFCDLFAESCDRFDVISVSVPGCNEALEKLQNDPPFDLVFIDIKLGPGQDGIDLFRDIRRMIPRQPVCFISGNLDMTVLDRIGQIGFAPVIRKPTDLSQGRLFEDMLRTFGVQVKQPNP